MARAEVKLSEAHGPPLPAEVRSAWDFFEQTVHEHPDSVALASVSQPHDLFGIPSVPLSEGDYDVPYLRWTFGGLRGAITRLVAGFRATGVQPGTLIFTLVHNCAEFVITKWAAYEMGCVLVPLNPRNLDNEIELRSMIQTAFLASPSKMSVIIAGTESMTKRLDALGDLRKTIKIVLSNSPLGDWAPFASLMNVSSHHSNGHQRGEDRAWQSSGTVLFTSGTTSLPKGVFHRYSDYSHHLEGIKMLPDQGALPPNSRCCCVLPNNHLLAFYSHWNAYAWAAAWIFPGPVFQPDEMLKTLRRERITHIDLVPTMLHALLGAEGLQNGPLGDLDSVVYAGAVVSPDTIRLTTDVLGANTAEALFGMTEGPVIRGIASDKSRASRVSDAGVVPVGWAGPGHTFRVADPETNEIVPVGELGELQASGPAIAHYLGDAGQSSFYTDSKGRRWLKTGDQAKMNKKGCIFITGRYKDMIIRGGENISPTAIETAIRRNPKLARLDPQVVGVPDHIAGEVPVVVVSCRELTADTRELIRTTVANDMGTMYVPAEVFSLHELAMTDYPRTMSGKIQKVKLAEIVKKHHEDLELSTTEVEDDDGDEHLATAVKEVWARATGQDVSRIPINAPISTFADSILIIRVRGKIRIKTGKTLSMQEMNSDSTIAEQIEMLKTKGYSDSQSPAPIAGSKRKRVEPPSMEDMVHIARNPSLFATTKELVSKTLAPHGLDWDDVEAVFPCHDHLNVFQRVLDPLGINTGLLAHKASKAQLRAAIEKTLENNRLIGSFIVRIESPPGSSENKNLHVVIRPGKKLFDLLFEDGGRVKTRNDLREQIPIYPNNTKCQRPGPLAKIKLFSIEDSGTGGAILATHHTIVDAFMVQLLCDDLEKYLASPHQSLRPHVDFKLWSDSYYSLRTSPEAMASVQWHASRLKSLASLQRSIWPVMPSEEVTQGGAMVRRIFDAPDIRRLREDHGLMPATVLKTAQALLNVHRTGATHAVFSNFEACRSGFPFLPKSMEALGHFDASDVSGPTFTSVINVLEVKSGESALGLLMRVQEDQEELTRHAAAPAQLIKDALGPEGNLMEEAVRSQWFNWSPGVGASIGDPYENIEVLNHNPTESSARGMGLGVRAGVGGPDGVTYVVIVRTAILDKDTAGCIAEDLERLTMWLVNPENWNEPVDEILKAL
ncbi:hypothetical protein diail_3266 [Diaporthe ilicicola]|nr:hypothetical protein diail_3266 [Diaporthe ilicicola]